MKEITKILDLEAFRDSLEASADTERSVIPEGEKEEWLERIREAAVRTKEINE